jgi:ABC-2 type transport system permease protein
MSRIEGIFTAVTKNTLRSRVGLFFSALFPLMLLLVFGSVFGGTFAGSWAPLLIGAFVMTNGIVALPTIATEFKRRGVLKRLSATPLSKLEWIVGNVLSQTLLAVILTVTLILAAWLVFGVTPVVNPISAVILFTGAVMFSGIGMVIAGFLKDPEAASGLGNAISFPMMFLSGTYFPLSIMPGYLQNVARFLPLYYFQDGLKASMMTGNVTTALGDLAVIGVLAIAFILVGSFATKWRGK